MKWAESMTKSFGIKVHRTGELPPEGVLLVANHRSYIDAPVILKDIPAFFLAKAELADWPVIGQAARLGNTIFVKREDFKSRKECLKAISERINEGSSVVIFPEGTTYEGPGIMPFRKGIFKMAARHGYPVMPVSIEYKDRDSAWVKDDSFIGHFIRTFSKKEVEVSVNYGPVLKSENEDELYHGAVNWISNQLRNNPLNN